MISDTPQIDQEVTNLLHLAYAKRANGRSLLFNTITDLLERRDSELSKIELSLMSEILEKLLNNVEMSVRRKLADRLALNKDAPVDLIILLANDQIEVATPVLLLSKLLSDKELIKVIRHKTAQHQLSIASRKKLSSGVCRELITMGNSKTLVMLLNNHDADIDEESLLILIEKSKNNISIQPPLIERPDLPKEMATRMYQWVSLSLRQSILTKLNLSETDVNELLRKTVDEVAKGEVDQITRERSEVLLVNKLYKAGKLQPSFLMKCLNQGHSTMFEIAFSRLISVPLKSMRSFLYDRGAETLAVSCCAAGIDQSVFLTIYGLTRSIKKDDTKLSDEEIANAFDYFKHLDKKRAQTTLQKWVAETSHMPVT